MSLAQVHALVAQHGANAEQPCVEGDSLGNAAGTVAGYYLCGWHWQHG